MAAQAQIQLPELLDSLYSHFTENFIVNNVPVSLIAAAKQTKIIKDYYKCYEVDDIHVFFTQSMPDYVYTYIFKFKNRVAVLTFTYSELCYTLEACVNNTCFSTNDPTRYDTVFKFAFENLLHELFDPITVISVDPLETYAVPPFAMIPQRHGTSIHMLFVLCLDDSCTNFVKLPLMLVLKTMTNAKIVYPAPVSQLQPVPFHHVFR